MSFLDHLEVLRWHLIRSLASILVFATVAFIFNDFVFDQIILAPSRSEFITYQKLCELSSWLGSDALCIKDLQVEIINRKMIGQFSMHIASSFVIGLIFAFPYTFWEIWRFVKPGLYHNEQRATSGATFFVSLLFGLGVTFGYYIVSPLAVNFLTTYQVSASIANTIDLTSYVSTLIMIVLSGGVMFQLPIVTYFVARAGLVGAEDMRTYRKHAIVVILLISAVITPPDVVTQVLIAMPVLLLYEMSIMIAGRVQKRLAKEAEAILGKSVDS
ncbi:twin-arginine translocase subunit TatC [Algivirga pacifica]|uniref:Sec-independent protein translocase protein TatC n=1 Tax=Algivirga pacifica TaxID=1162670 RepID=A0ABP9DLY5_9BACT